MSGRFGERWIEQAGARVLAEARRLVRRHAVGVDQRKLLEKAVGDMRLHEAPPGMYLPSVHLPLLVAAGIRGEGDDPIALAACTALLELGMDLLDHLADQEIGEHWRGWQPGSIQLAAMVLGTSLAPIALAGLPLPGERSALLHARLAGGLMAIAAGQQLDLELASSPLPDLERVERANAGKTGERRALYAELAALQAGADHAVCQAYAAFGRELGIAYQLTSDLHDLFAAGDSRDLRNGTRTWPIAWALSGLEGGARDEMLAVLHAAQVDPAARQRARAALRAKGAVLRTLLQAELHLQRARKALERAGPKEPAATALLAMASSRSEADLAPA